MQLLDELLSIAYEICEDESTEFMLAYLQDTVEIAKTNYNLDEKIDSFEYVMEWLQNDG